MTRTKKLALFRIPSQSNPSLEGKNSSVHSFLQLLNKVTVLMHGNLFHATVKMGVLIFKLLILVSPTVQWHILTPSVSTLLLRICIDSLPVFWMSLMHFRIKHFPFMKEYMSVHYPIIYTGLIDIIPVFHSIEIKVHFFFGTLMEFREQNQP